MGNAAVPEYVGQNFKETPPGHRFGLYFPVWRAQDWTREQDDTREKNKGKKGALKSVVPLGDTAAKLLQNLRQRQETMATGLAEKVFALPAKSTSPFMTGTGMEHPLENGFAFLNPYGLPYLPGSSIKGVLRRAAEDLILGLYGDPEGWDVAALWWLFGFEAGSDLIRQIEDEDLPIDNTLLDRYMKNFRELQELDQDSLLQAVASSSEFREKIHSQGTLVFWDAFPEPAGNKLAMDIMTPHYSDYYQHGKTPADCGQPNPILFLTVPPGSRFDFYVQCQTERLPEPLRASWQKLLQAAFKHAFDWLGFGAKTAVGYGQMAADQETADQREEQAQKAEIAALPPEKQALLELRSWFEEDRENNRKEPGGRLANRLNELIKEAAGWPKEHRVELADLGEKIYGYLGGSSKKKKERKAKLQALRDS